MGQETQSDSDNISTDFQNEHDVDISEQNKKTYKCTYPDCHATFLRSSKLERHVRLHTGEKPYKCQHEGCTKAYTNSSHLKRHLETHNSAKKIYKCTVCSLGISNLHNLKRHYKRVHSADAQISCNECDKTFNKKCQLTKHKITCHESEIYKCDKCKKAFTNNSRFKEHQKIHEESKKYPCPVPECSEVFNKWLLLCAHQKAKHVTGHKCNSCGKIFLSKSRLRSHSKIHSENRVILQCPYDKCNKTYYFKSNLTNHVKINHLGTKFVCDMCSLGLSSKRKLIQHIQLIHQENQEKRSKAKKKLNGQRKKRKDAGVPKKSALTQLIGLSLPNNMEKLIMERKNAITVSTEGCDKNANDIEINSLC